MQVVFCGTSFLLLLLLCGWLFGGCSKRFLGVHQLVVRFWCSFLFTFEAVSFVQEILDLLAVPGVVALLSAAARLY